MNVPEGHSLTQEALLRKGVVEDVQVRHWLAEGPEHVPHAASHASQTVDALAYLPTGVQVVRHVPWSGLKKGDAVAHDVQSVVVGPLQVAHDGWHEAHVSGVNTEPPAHVYPASIVVQSPLHPSSETVLDRKSVV